MAWLAFRNKLAYSFFGLALMLFPELAQRFLARIDTIDHTRHLAQRFPQSVLDPPVTVLSGRLDEPERVLGVLGEIHSVAVADLTWIEGHYSFSSCATSASH